MHKQRKSRWGDRWTIDAVSLLAKQYMRRADFASRSRNAYMWAWKHGVLDDVCAHMEASAHLGAVKWTVHSAFAEASKFARRSEFKKHQSGAYSFLLDRGLLEPACMHMQGVWHVFEVMARAMKYTSLAEFRSQSSGCYTTAKRQGWIEAVSAHMARKSRWTPEKVVADAARHCDVASWRLRNPGAYRYALLHGVLDEATCHMPPPKSGFKKDAPATLYYLRITTPAGAVLYKIGITNRPVQQRISSLTARGSTIEPIRTIPFTSGREARLLEKQLHREFAAWRYVGDYVLGNGNTELFTRDVLADYF